MSVLEITSQEGLDEVVANNAIVVIDFHADWCPPCKAVGPKYHSLAEKSTLPGVAFCSIDVDACQDIAADHGIKSIPTFIFYKDGKEEAKCMGSNIDTVKNKLAELTKS